MIEDDPKGFFELLNQAKPDDEDEAEANDLATSSGTTLNEQPPQSITVNLSYHEQQIINRVRIYFI